MRVEVPGRRSRVEHLPTGLEIVIPAKRQVFVMLFMSVWLCGWAFGEIIVPIRFARVADSPVALFFLVWFTLWTIGGAFVLYSLFWMLAGKEIVVARPDVLSVKRDVFCFGIKRAFIVSQVMTMRVRYFP